MGKKGVIPFFWSDGGFYLKLHYFIYLKLKYRGGGDVLNFVICDDNVVVLDRLSRMLESIFITHSIEATIRIAVKSAR
jgi:hypothetical protein